MKSFFVTLLFCIIINQCSCSTIIGFYDLNTTDAAPTPDWAKDIPTYPQDVISVGFNFSTLTTVFGTQRWAPFSGRVAFPTTDLCTIKPESIKEHLTEGDILITPKFFGCSRQSLARTIARNAPHLKALLHYDTADVKAYGFSQSFTDGSRIDDIHIISLLIPKTTAASFILALESNSVIEIDLYPELPTWNTLSRKHYVAFQVIMMLLSLSIVIFALYRLIIVVRKNIQRKMPVFNISLFVITLELISNLIRLVFFATQPLLSAVGGFSTLSYPAWRVLITFTFPLVCMSSTALILYWHELLLMKMNGTKLAFMANPKSKIGFSAISIGTFLLNIITTGLDASGYDVSFFIVLAICIAYVIVITIGTYYVGFKVLNTVKLLPQIRTISIKLMLAVSWIWVVVVGAILHLTPAYWSVPNQAVMMAILFIGLEGLSVSNLIVFKQRKSRGTGSSKSSGSGSGSGGSSSVAEYNTKNAGHTGKAHTVSIAATEFAKEDKERSPKASPTQVFIEVQSASTESAQSTNRTSTSISSHVSSTDS